MFELGNEGYVRAMFKLGGPCSSWEARAILMLGNVSYARV